MERIIFVGMHNKPGKTPLCSSTKSGKLVDRIAEGFTHIKTNLYAVDYYPATSGEKHLLASDWANRVDPAENDIIILLGREVHDNFLHKSKRIIKLPHPSSQWSHSDMDAYVSGARSRIKIELSKSLTK